MESAIVLLDLLSSSDSSDISNFSDSQFKQNFRLNQSTFDILQKFETSSFFPINNHGGREVKSAKCHLLAFLWFAGNKEVLRTVALLFDMSLSTLHSVIDRVQNFLINLAPQVIKFTKTVEEMRLAAEKFENIAGFPGVIGCIDGTYINIRTPKNKIKSTYYYINRHDQTSITLQGICDADKKFIDVFTGCPGKIHDSRIFKMSFIHDKIFRIGQNFHIIGDAAYPLSENVLTPFRDYGNLTVSQKKYNLRFSATRVKIENTFGVLKARFRQLMHTDFHTVDSTNKFIISCCVLHNLCISNNDLFEEEISCERTFEDEYRNYDQREQMQRRLGGIKQNNICQQL